MFWLFDFMATTFDLEPFMFVLAFLFYGNCNCWDSAMQHQCHSDTVRAYSVMFILIHIHVPCLASFLHLLIVFHWLVGILVKLFLCSIFRITEMSFTTLVVVVATFQGTSAQLSSHVTRN